jgi:pSer/pThr/pTyr-binding forkhead associated (FHA) protein
MMHCPRCQVALEPGAFFCAECGHRISAPPSARPSLPATEFVPASALAQLLPPKTEIAEPFFPHPPTPPDPGAEEEPEDAETETRPQPPKTELAPPPRLESRTPTLPDADGARTTVLPRQAVLEPATTVMPELLGIRLEPSEGPPIFLSGAHEYFFGRSDPPSGWAPAADLTAYGGEERGVSRRHARLFYRDGGLWLEDLSSRNGTYLNRERLYPERPRAVNRGDEIKLGRIAMRIVWL